MAAVTIEDTVRAGAKYHGLTVMLCLATVTAALEGIDIQSIGVAAPKILSEFGLDMARAGFLFSSGVVGLFLGAILGGVLSDRLGRKWVLIGAIGVFGICSLSTTLASNLSMLVVARFFTGLGLGGAMPNLVAMVSECAPRRWRTQLATAIWAGAPLGGLLAAQIAASGAGWRSIFLAGGIPPLIVAALMAFFLPNSATARRERASGAGWKHALGGEGRVMLTAFAWISHFATLLILYLLLNWLPLLISQRGFKPHDAALSSSAYNIGASLGALVLAALLVALPKRLTIVLAYAGMAAGLVGLAFAGPSLSINLLCAAISGFFVIGGQYLLYGITPELYPSQARGTGVGAAIAVGRLGGIAGPALAGEMLHAGFTAKSLLLGLSLLVLVAMSAMMAALMHAHDGDLPTPPMRHTKQVAGIN